MRPLCISHEDLCLRFARKVKRCSGMALNIEQASNFSLWLALKRNVYVSWRNCKLSTVIFDYYDMKDHNLDKETLNAFLSEYLEKFPNFNYIRENEEIFHAH